MKASGHYDMYDWFESTYVSILRNEDPFVRAMSKRELRRLWHETGESQDMKETKKKLYLLQVLDDLEPVVRGPYDFEAARTAAARNIRRDRGMRDGLFMMDCPDEPEISSFGAKELEEI
jgi:hypothetical protein